MRLLLRILIIGCYFLPFSFFHFTCTIGYANTSYNEIEMQAQEKEAAELENSRTIVYSMAPGDTSGTLVNPGSAGSMTQLTADSLKSFVPFLSVIRPVDNSISVIGHIIFHKNWMGRILSVLSLLVSIAMLIGYRLFISSSLPFIFSVVIFFCLNILMFLNFLSNISLLWGSWILYILLFIQLVIELIYHQKLSKRDTQ